MQEIYQELARSGLNKQEQKRVRRLLQQGALSEAFQLLLSMGDNNDQVGTK